MNKLILTGIQTVTSIWEVWMCYQLLLITVIDEQYRTKADKTIMWCAMVLSGLLLGLNRLNSFFSSLVFVLSNIILIIICICFNRRKKMLCVGVIVLYLTLVAILDIALALISYDLLGKQFISSVYISTTT